MRTSPPSVQVTSFRPLAFLGALLAIVLLRSAAFSNDLCPMLRGAWDNVRTYDCTYRSVTSYEGKRTETLMRYRFQAPDKVRMDIVSPRKGAVVIYNPAVSAKVRVRPFPAVKSLNLSYALTHKRVSTDSGRTIDKSHLPARAAQACDDIAKSPSVLFRPDRSPREIEESYNEKGKQFTRRYYLSPDNKIARIETRNDRGELENVSEWSELKVNPDLSPDIFESLDAKP